MNFRISRFFLAVMMTACFISCNHVEPYRNPKLPLSERVNDLVSRMTLEEKISQMMNNSPAIERLDIPSYNWWSEGLHGVASAGVATVFPQAIGLGAMWDSAMTNKVADVISTEFRAKYNDFQKKGDHGIFKGITVWSPNINIFRDPRWGRGQETYGEDPYLTGTNGIAFVKGLQGHDSVYLKCVSTVKHFAVHSGPESTRHIFNATPEMRDFMETYSPQFEMCVREAGVYSVMSAYNFYMGQPCSGSNFLLKDVLRGRWGFKGYVVSDCDAIADILTSHKYVKSMAEAAAMCVKAGTDLNCGDAYMALKEAVEKGLIKESDIDVCLKRLFIARFKLGMFDPGNKVPFNQIGIEQNDTKEHRRLALEAARKSIVLLKNEKHTLPLSKNIKSITVIGPNAGIYDALYGNYNGVSSNPVTLLKGILNKTGNNMKVFHLDGCNYTDTTPVQYPIDSLFMMSDGKAGVKADFYKDSSFEGTPYLTKRYSNLDFNWGLGGFKEFPDLKNEKNYYIRFTASLQPDETCNYFFQLNSSYPGKLYIDDQVLIDKKPGHQIEVSQSPCRLEAGKKYNLRFDYSSGFDWSMFQVLWGKANNKSLREIAAQAAQSDIIIFAGGISNRLENEEMAVNTDGFKGGDRTKIELPSVQTDLLKELKATGKPIVFINMSGGAMAIPWEAENIPAIIQAWYPGEEGGNAIADVLFGDYNPAGRLPVTFYKSSAGLPAFDDYNMKGRTYRYFNGEALYPFGFGLSYTTFNYANLIFPLKSKTGDSIRITVEVGNTGNMDGEEVVQLYIKFMNASCPVPNIALQGYRRISLKAGEKKNVVFNLRPKQLSMIDNNNNRIEEPGQVEIFIGGCQPGKYAEGGKQSLSGIIQLTGNAFKVEN